jgi:hypothetical protein
LSIELLFQVLILILQVLYGLLEGINIPLVFIICTFCSGEDTRVNMGISTILHIKIFIIMVIHVGVHVQCIALANITSAFVKDNAFTINPHVADELVPTPAH